MIANATARARCSARSLALGEDPAGTASTLTAFLLLEHGGPWPASARDAPLPAGVTDLLTTCDQAAVRPLLIRRHRSGPGMPKRPRVALAVCDRDGGSAAATALADGRMLAHLPLEDLLGQLRAGETPDGWDRVNQVFLTCTHGRHDVCCAERGRPVATAFEKVAGETAWEVSHIGGDRFAANVLVLPDGLYYGRVPVGRVAELVDAHRNGRCLPDLLRGRTSLPWAAQAAEIALRCHLDVADLSAVRLASLARSGRRTSTTWTVSGRGTWRVGIDTTHPGPPRPLTCSTAAAAPPVHTVVELTELRTA